MLDAMLVARDVDPNTLVPADRWAGPILALGNDPLELRIFQRVGLHVHCESFVGGVRGRPFGNGPRLQNTIHFQP